MKILLVHNYYQQAGGEDVVFAAERTLLRNNGHTVTEFVEQNDRVKEMGRIGLAFNTIWSRPSQKQLTDSIRQNRPQVVHFHNTFMMISPAAYYTCREMNVPVVQTLHNFRLQCPSAIFYRDGKICEDCLSKTYKWPGVVNGCYRNSPLQTSGVSAMLAIHKILRTWQNQVDAYIALTEFAKRKFIQGGLPSEKIFVKPNFIESPTQSSETKDTYAIFIGRFTQEKGIRTLLQAWKCLGKFQLKIFGNGPLMNEVQAFIQDEKLTSIEVLGQKNHEEVINHIKKAAFLVFPSEWYEGFPMTIAEAFACGVPVIASRLGAMEEIIKDGRTGLHFTPGDSEDLAVKIEWAWTHEKEMQKMGKAARREYEEKYTAEKNYKMLMDIYSKAMERMNS